MNLHHTVRMSLDYLVYIRSAMPSFG